MESVYTLNDFVDMLRRRARLIVSVTVLGSVVSLFLAFNMGHMYQSAEVLQVVQPKIDDSLAPQSAGDSSARHLQLVRQRLMARENVLEVADKFNLFPNRRTVERLTLMREAVTITDVAAARDGPGEDGSVSVLTIAATLETPELAQQVAHEFAQRTIALSLKVRTAKAMETVRFFTAEEARLIAELEAIEQELTTFRRQNDLAISGNIEFRQSQIASINAALLEIERERIARERDLEELDQGQRAETLARQTRELEAEIETLDAQHTLLEARAQTLSQQIETTPRIERELGVFHRRQEKVHNQLELVAARLAEAEVAFKLEEQSQTAHLTVIEPAIPPDYPVSPSRKKAAVMGGMISLASGIFLAFILDLWRPVIRTAAQMQSRVGLSPVVTIPMAEVGKGNRNPWRRLLKFKRPSGRAGTTRTPNRQL